MKLSWKGTVAGALTAALVASSTVLGAGSASAQPTPPTRFFGTVTLNGQPAPNGATVQARVGSNNCGTGSVTSAGSSSSYVVDVLSATTQPGCGTDGATVSFTVNGAPASQTGTFQTGAFVSLNLTAQAATPTPAPTASPTPVRTATPTPPPPTATPIRTPTAVPATATPQRPAAAPQPQRPAAPAAAPAAQRPATAPAALPRTGAGTSDNSAAFALLGLALVAAAFGAGSVMISRRSR